MGGAISNRIEHLQPKCVKSCHSFANQLIQTNACENGTTFKMCKCRMNCNTPKDKYMHHLTPTDPKAPRHKSRPSTLQLHLNLNMILNQYTNVADSSQHQPDCTICALRFTNHNVLLLKFNSADSAHTFRSHNSEHNLLASQVCPSAHIQPHLYRVIMRFIPCDGSFDPTDATHLHQIEEDLDLPLHSITSANWIKKLELRAPSQQTANVKVSCSSTFTANY